MDPEPPPPPQDPYRSVWNMSPVGGTSGRRRSELRIVPGLIAAVVVLVPFGVLTGYLWLGPGATGAGWVVALIGLAGAFSMGAFVASDRS